MNVRLTHTDRFRRVRRPLQVVASTTAMPSDPTNSGIDPADTEPSEDGYFSDHRARRLRLVAVGGELVSPRCGELFGEWRHTIRSVNAHSWTGSPVNVDREGNFVTADEANTAEFRHEPVMLAEVLEYFADVPAGIIVDATCGGAGHSAAILDSREDLRLVGLDRDPHAVSVARERLARFGDRAEVHHARFDEMTRVLAGRPVSGVLFDLGVSSTQFDTAGRGFSYRFDAPLDMRMDTTSGPTAAEILNSSTPQELRHILTTYGDERFADRIARALVAARPVVTTAQLVEVVTAAIPAATRRTGGHPAKRTFQALRIEVNDELRVLAPAVDSAIEALVPGGRCVVLSYHSGEDRIVKNRFRLAETGGCACPSGLPCVCGALPRGRMVRRGVTRPSEAEQASNPRAASAVARVFETGASGRSSVRSTDAPVSGLARPKQARSAALARGTESGSSASAAAASSSSSSSSSSSLDSSPANEDTL